MSFYSLVLKKPAKLLFSAIAFVAISAVAAPKPLTVWIMPNGASPKEKLEQTLEAFTQETGIPTEVQILDWGEAWNRISLALSGKQEAPDVLQLGTTWIPYFASRGELKSLNGELKRINPERFVDVSWLTTHTDGDSTIYSVPWFIDVRPVLANKRVLKKYGISRESLQTYEGFANAIRLVDSQKEVLDDGTIVKGFAFPGKSDWNIPHNFAPWIWSNGGHFIKKDSLGKWHANILSEETLLGISSYLNFILDSLVDPSVLQLNTAQIAQLFNNGELAFVVSTSEVVMQTRFHGNQGGLSNARIGSDSIAVILIPTGKTGSVSFIGGSNLAIPANNRRKEALDLLLFMTNDKNLAAYTQQIGFLPPSKKVLDTWDSDEEYHYLINAFKTGRNYVSIPEWSELEQILVAMFSIIWEQVEIPSMFSEEKLYEIFKLYSLELDKKLGNESSEVMSLETFKQIWTKDEVQDKFKVQENDDSKSIIAANAQKAPIVFVVMLLFGFLFAFTRKRKK